MKINIQFTEKEASILAMVTKKYDFMNRINADKLSKKYSEGNCAGSFEYSGITSKGAEVKFETHEKLILAASSVYLKYADQVNGILCAVKSLVMSFKSLFKNFESDYNRALNNAFEEIRQEDAEKKAKEKEEKPMFFKKHRKEGLEK